MIYKCKPCKKPEELSSGFFHNIIGKFEFILGSNWGVKFLSWTNIQYLVFILIGITIYCIFNA